LIIIDFPGFADSSGPIISLFIQIALYNLIDKFNPKILLIEDINNIQGSYKEAKEIGEFLNGMVENSQESSLLGLTK